jgi:hypothetical protein
MASGFQAAPTGTHALSSAVRLRKTTSLAGIFCSGSLTTATPYPRRDKGERARGAVHFLGDSRLETRATASFQKPIALIRLHTI